MLAFARALYPRPKLLIVDEPDSTLREGLSKSYKTEVDDFLARGGILILLSRLALKAYEPGRRFTLENGELNEIKLDRMRDSKVIKIRNPKKAAVGAVDEPSGPDSQRVFALSGTDAVGKSSSSGR